MHLLSVTRDAIGRLLAALSQRAHDLGNDRLWVCLGDLADKVRVHDELTGLLTRQEFERRATRFLRQHAGGTLVLCDIDHLHHVNRAIGYEAVDACLKATASSIRRLTEGSSVGRLGGDQFAVLLKDVHRAQAVAESIRLAMQRAFCAERTRTVDAFPDLRGSEVLTMTVGGARAVAGSTLAELLQHSDEALSNAKDAGRNRVVWL